MTALLGVKSGGHPKESGMKSDSCYFTKKKKKKNQLGVEQEDWNVSLLTKTYEV